MTSLDNYASLLKALAPRQCSRNAERLSELQNRFSVAADGALKRNAARVDALAGMVSVLSPDNTLRRGYSITRVDGKAVTDASILSPGQRIVTCFRHGDITSVVE